jgi:rhodanese-related sulfurtransferase
MKKTIALVVFALISLITSAQEVKSIVLNATKYEEQVFGKDLQLIDLRTPKEYRAGFIDDAINIDYFDQTNFKNSFEKLDKNKPVYIYCRSGNRSQKSVPLLLDFGFTEIYDLKGGYKAWVLHKN